MMYFCNSCYYWEQVKFTGNKRVKNGRLYYEAECMTCGKLMFIHAKKVES